MLNFSQRPELALHGEVTADILAALSALRIRGIVVGAFARDLHLHYGAGIPVQRGTEDVDFAFVIDSWNQFNALREQLIGSGSFLEIEGKQHRLKHRTNIKVDLMPFGRVERGDRTIAWPPAGDFVMDVFGFSEALESADTAVLPGNAKIQVVSLPALALLKIVAWEDRHQRSPGKDAADLMLISRNYLSVGGNSDRLWSEFVSWTQAPTFDYELSGARMLGHDIRNLLDEDGLARIANILSLQLDQNDVGELTQEMDRRAPENAHLLLQQLYEGLRDA